MQKRKSGNAQGIDVSRYQGSIDWKKVANDGITFAIMKATEGQSYRDQTFLGNVKNAKAAGLLVGAYHFIKATSKITAKLEAANFYKAIQDAGGIQVFDLPLVMDYESDGAKIGKAMITEVSKAFLEELEKLTGKKGMIYTYPAFIGNFSGLQGYDLWIARYSATREPENASGWTQWTIWQYHGGIAGEGGTLPNGKQRVDGIGGPVDLNEYNGTPQQMRDKYTKKPSKPVETPVKKPELPVGQLATDKAVKLSIYQPNSKGYREVSTYTFKRGDTSYVPVKAVALITGKSVGFEERTKKASINEVTLKSTIIIGSDSYAPARDVGNAIGMEVHWDNKKQAVIFDRKDK